MTLKSFFLYFIKPTYACLGNETGGTSLLLENIQSKNLIMNSYEITHTTKLVKIKTHLSKYLKTGHLISRNEMYHRWV